MNNASMMNLMLLVVFIGIFYFLMIRPQNKKAKAEREMRNALIPGDDVVTIGGIRGKVTDVKEDYVVLDVAYGRNAHLKVEFQKGAIGGVIAKSDKPAKAKAAEEEEAAPVKTPTKDKKITPKKLTAKKAEAADDDASEKSEN